MGGGEMGGVEMGGGEMGGPSFSLHYISNTLATH
jgi:hypothetical protein